MKQMTKQPRVSVVIPTHNRPQFLKRTLEHILGQSYKKLEIIVVSNGFNGENKKVIEQLADHRLIYREQENSGGPSSPRNHGMRLAKGGYIAFCDDDDIWLSKKLEKQILFLEKHKEFMGSYTGMSRFNEKEEWVVDYENGEATFESTLYYNCIPISSLVVRRECLKKIGFFEESQAVGAAEDYEYLLRILSHYKLHYMKEILIKYWSADNRTTTTTPSLRSHFKYLKETLYCYYSVHKKIKIPIYKFLTPSFFQVFHFSKSVAYLIKKNW